MRSIATIGKNLKLLFRSKESAYTIVFGPLLIILVVSFAFMGSTDDLTVRVGVQVQEHTDLTGKVINALNENNYLVSVYPDNETCIDSVREGTNQVCLTMGVGDQLPVTFYLDMSRVNIIYQIIDDLSAKLDLQAEGIRKQVASSAAVRMQTAAQLISEALVLTQGMETDLANASLSLDPAQGAIAQLPTEVRNVTDLRLIRGYYQGFAQNTVTVADEAIGVIDEALDIIHDLENECADCPDKLFDRVDDLKSTWNEAETKIYLITEDATPKQIEEIRLLLQYAIEDLDVVQSTIANATISASTIHAGVDDAAATLASGSESLRKVNAKLSYTQNFLESDTLDADLASSPITTSVVSITVSDDRLSFAYPYLLVLVIMFIGMLLASMLVVTEKTSHAAFRNFTTPISDAYHVCMSFLTAFLILSAEIVIILLVSGFFVAQPLLLNLSTTLLIIGVAIVMFTFLGMIVGYLSSTHEAAMIASISIASVFLFISNFIIPIEGMARLAQLSGAINPYIVLSELLRKSMLYEVGMSAIASQLGTLVVFIVLLLLATVFIQRRIKRAYFRQEETLLPAMQHLPAPLRIGDTVVHNTVDLMEALDRMTRAEFSEIVRSDENVIAHWVAKELRNKRLARHMRTQSKEKMILRLDRHLKRHGKRIKR